jgi:hypothetical protein
VADGVLEWSKRQRHDWLREIKLIEDGYKTTFEIRNGAKVDTTQETLDTLRARLSMVEAVIAKHESDDA